MANWSLPTITDLYTAVISLFKDRIDDAARQMRTSVGAPTNMPDLSIRWNDTSDSWESYDLGGLTWIDLATKYGIDVDLLDGQHGAFYLAWTNLTGVPSTFTPSAHDHDGLYYPKATGDDRYGATLDILGNTIRLKDALGNVHTTLTVPFATDAADAVTVSGFAVDQAVTAAADMVVNSIALAALSTFELGLRVGKQGFGGSLIEFLDHNSAAWRTFEYSDSDNEWRVEDNGAVMRRLFHEGHLPDWTEIAGKPSTFAPTAHGHDFGSLPGVPSEVLQTLRGTTAEIAVVTGVVGSLIYDTTLKTLTVHDGATAGGFELARADAVATNVTNIATNVTNIGLKAPSASPTFTGTVAVPVPSGADDSTQPATTSWVRTHVGAKTISNLAPSGGANGDVWYQV